MSAPEEDLLDLLLEAVRLKALPRAGWVRAGIDRPESVAAHSWGVAWLVLTLLPPELDRERALSYAVLHDLPEVRVGDLTPHDRVAPHEKARREHEAMRALASGPLLELWEAYEAQADDESRFVRQLDRLDMALQALAQHTEGATGMRGFIDSADRVVDHPTLRAFMQRIYARLEHAGGAR